MDDLTSGPYGKKPSRAKLSSPRMKQATGTGGAHRAPAVSRAATVLRLLAGEKSGLGVTEIARKVGLVPSTCLHVLRALVDEGFIAFDTERKTYRTGVGLLTLVRDAMASNEFRQVVQPTLERLATDYKITAVAVELDSRDRMVVVALARFDSLVSLHVNVGSRFPSLISATGRCVAAASKLSREELEQKFAALRWERAPRFEDWYAEVERVRADGCAVDRGNYIRGLGIVAALLPSGLDRVMRGIALVGFEHNLTDQRVTRQIKEDLAGSVQALAAEFN
jgi:DNA-binding IclR family transcriptional regulator